MKRKETYLSRDFRETAAQRFPTQAKQLNAAFDMRLNALLAENAGMGYERVKLIDTTDGRFMTPKEAKRLMLRGSTLLVGRK